MDFSQFRQSKLNETLPTFVGISTSSRWSHLTGTESKKGKLKITQVWKGLAHAAKAKSASVLSEDH